MVLLSIGCNTSKEKTQKPNTVLQTTTTSGDAIHGAPKLDVKEANALAELPLNCINIEYPNKLSQTLGSDEDIKTPESLHPAFYGCFDWHSAVHGHWSLVRLLKSFPNLEHAEDVKARLLKSISKINIELEVKYFEGKYNKSYERTYGWAWLLKLAE